MDAYNYRPIWILDITYKIISPASYNRIITKINATQSVDQVGFIKGFPCDEHFITCAILIEKLWRAKRQLWVCAVDLKKAFDSVEVSSIWQALKECDVEEPYIEFL